MIVVESVLASEPAGSVVNASCVGAVAVTVSCCMAGASEPEEIPNVGAAATVSVYSNVALLDPAAMVTDATGLFSASRNPPASELVLRFTLCPPAPAGAAAPPESCNWMVIAAETAPAAIVTGELTNTTLVAASIRRDSSVSSTNGETSLAKRSRCCGISHLMDG